MIKIVKANSYIIVFIFLIFSCKKGEKPNISFYYWNTTFNLDKREQNFIDSLNVETIYVRFFDVVKENGHIKPNAQINFEEKLYSQTIIPVVFFENDVFVDIDEKALNLLVQNVSNEIQFIGEKINLKSPNEIQFDCDWTKSTKSNYFTFLEKFKSMKPDVLLSATIRLHQIKYRQETGIPNVDYGVLMYYSTGNPLNFSKENAILDNEIAMDYIRNIANYPLHLDIALPMFSWAIVKNEFNETRLISGIKSVQLLDTSLFKPIEKNYFSVKKSNYLNGLYLYEGQRIKLETIETKDLLVAANNINKYYPKKAKKIIFYNLDGINFDNITTSDLIKISNSL